MTNNLLDPFLSFDEDVEISLDDDVFDFDLDVEPVAEIPERHGTPRIVPHEDSASVSAVEEEDGNGLEEEYDEGSDSPSAMYVSVQLSAACYTDEIC